MPIETKTDAAPSGPLDDFETAYLECAFWLSMCHSSESDASEDSSADDLGYTFDDLAPEALAEARRDCADFQSDARAAEYINGNEVQAGHDFWLTRNGHGAGFWDRGDLYGSEEAGEYLSERAKGFGECTLYDGDNGLLYFMSG